LAAAAACGPDNNFIIEDRIIFDEFFQDPAEAVDILLIIDNSCSMLAEQEKLSTEFEAFVEFFFVANTDYHIGVTTTDMDYQGEQGRLVGDTKVITRSTPDPAQVFRENVLVGADGSGYEQGLEAARTALSQGRLNGVNAGFYRDEAELSLIFVGDEDDASQGTVDEFLSGFYELKGQRNRRAFQASALIGVHPITGEPAVCGRDPGDPFAGADDMPRYWDLATKSQGVVSSICADDFNSIVHEMGLAASRVSDVFTLSRDPVPETVEVTIFVPGSPEFLGDGWPLPQVGLEDGRFAWVLEGDGQANWIRFVDQEDLPPISSRILVTYERDF
jgi:hypothetical protein